MHRLRGFDYKQPYFYMVTLKRLSGLGALSHIVDDSEKQEDVWGRPRYLLENDITKAFVDVIRSFHNTWYCIEPITCFSIMPDHIHLLIKIRDIENRVSLAVIVRMLIRELEKRWGRLLAEQPRARLLKVVLLPALPGNISSSFIGTIGLLRRMGSLPPLRVIFEKIRSVLGLGVRIANISVRFGKFRSWGANGSRMGILRFLICQF